MLHTHGMPQARDTSRTAGLAGVRARADLIFFAGALANGDLWRDVVVALEDRYRCITIDLPLGAHPWPLAAGADRSASSLARLLLDCLRYLGSTGRSCWSGATRATSSGSHRRSDSRPISRTRR